jgi:hypothetical protein
MKELTPERASAIRTVLGATIPSERGPFAAELQELLDGDEFSRMEINRLKEACRYWQDQVGEPPASSPVSLEREREIRELLAMNQGHAAPFASGDTEGAVEGRAHMSIEPHGKKSEVLYIGRGPGSHGLNIVTISDPSYQWPEVKKWLLALPGLAEELLEGLTWYRNWVNTPRTKMVDPQPRQFTDCPLNGLMCSECGRAQRTTPGGDSCENGHGGVPGL